MFRLTQNSLPIRELYRVLLDNVDLFSVKSPDFLRVFRWCHAKLGLEQSTKVTVMAKSKRASKITQRDSWVALDQPAAVENPFSPYVLHRRLVNKLLKQTVNLKNRKPAVGRKPS